VSPMAAPSEVADGYSRENATSVSRDSTPLIAVLQQVRQDFADNRFVGWRTWIRALGDAARQADWSASLQLTTELEAGYSLSAAESRRVTELRDWILLNEGGIERAWVWYQDRLKAAGNVDQEANFRLALLYQRQNGAAAARVHLGRCLAREADTDLGALARSALYALEQGVDAHGTSHGCFDALWKEVTDGLREPALELAVMVRAALDGPDWAPRGRLYTAWSDSATSTASASQWPASLP